MKREIKFRAYHKARKEMYSVWSYATDFTFKNTMDGVGCDGVPDRTEELEVMQFTGLTDKNGKEIYEGDIVSVWHEVDEEIGDSYWTTGVVEYSPAEFYINGGGHSITCHFHYNASDRIVKGNIYENPNLLK